MDNPSFELEIPLPKRPRRIRNRGSIVLANLPRGSINSIRSYLSDRSNSTAMGIQHLIKIKKLDNGK